MTFPPSQSTSTHLSLLSLLWFSVASGHVVRPNNTGLRAYSQDPRPQRNGLGEEGIVFGETKSSGQRRDAQPGRRKTYLEKGRWLGSKYKNRNI